MYVCYFRIEIKYNLYSLYLESNSEYIDKCHGCLEKRFFAKLNKIPNFKGNFAMNTPVSVVFKYIIAI